MHAEAQYAPIVVKRSGGSGRAAECLASAGSSWIAR